MPLDRVGEVGSFHFFWGEEVQQLGRGYLGIAGLRSLVSSVGPKPKLSAF
jgi:hypothetical protein